MKGGGERVMWKVLSYLLKLMYNIKVIRSASPYHIHNAGFRKKIKFANTLSGNVVEFPPRAELGLPVDWHPYACEPCHRTMSVAVRGIG